jgi:hypothetical protein
MSAGEVAAFADGTPRPAFWEKLVLASYYRLLGSTQREAGAAVGRSERTIRVWEADRGLWTRASDEAKHRWLGEVSALARRQLLKAMMTAEGDLALKVLERVEEALAPPSQRVKHEGQVQLVDHPAWVALRTQLLRVLADFPEARLQVAAVLLGGQEPREEHRNGSYGPRS